MFTYVLPIVEKSDIVWRCYFKIDEIVFDVKYNDYLCLARVDANNRYKQIVSLDGAHTVEVMFTPACIVIKADRKITYVAGRNTCESYYDYECDRFMI